jgi:hypothetical protein
MTLCPIALLRGCKQCPAFTVCPLKGVIGDYEPPPPKRTPEQEDEEQNSK